MRTLHHREQACAAALREATRLLTRGSAHDVRELALALLADGQHGVIERRQLSALGLSSASIAHRVRQGRLRRIGRATYAVGRRALEPAGRRMAAVLSAGAPAAASHLAAAAAWNLLPEAAGPPDVTVPASFCPRSSSAARVHRSRTIAVEDLVILGGVPTTTVARTLADLGAVASLTRVRTAFVAAERLGLLDMRAIGAVLERTKGSRGARRLAEVVRAYDPRWQDARSNLEIRALDLARAAGLPEPRANEQVGGRYLPDLLWPDRRLIVEIDSDRFHAGAIDRRADARRDRDLRAAGYAVVRVPEAELDGTGAAAITRIAAALARSAR